MLRKLFLPMIFTLFLAGCATKEYDWVVKISGEEISPDEYVSAQMHAYVEARNMADYSTSVLSGDIEGVNADRWIDRHAIQWLKRNIYIQQEFENRNLKFGSDAGEYIRIFAQEGWDSVSRMYKNNGLDFQHYSDYLEFLYKEQLVFNDIFLYNEQTKITDREIDSYLEENLNRVSYFPVARINDDGTALDRQQDERLDAMVNAAVERINNGEDIQAVAGQLLTESGRLLGSSEDFSDGASFVTTEYITKSSMEIIFSFMDGFFELPQNVCVVYKLDNCYYICQKRQLCDTQVEYMYLKQDVVNILRDVEFENMVSEICEQMDVEYHPEAVKLYTPDKLKMSIG